MNKFQRALKRQNEGTPPIWLMRQAGRYHNHYQNLRRTHGFLELCKNPDLACETTMGPINDFDFDAAILFSDILFPIEAMGIPLDFAPGPKFDRYLRDASDLKYYDGAVDRIHDLSYQTEALIKIRRALPDEKGLIGFVGGPLTLYVFAVEGSHKNGIDSALKGFDDGRFDGFMERLIPMLAENLALQAKTDIDCLAILDSAAGVISPDLYETRYLPYLKELIRLFREKGYDDTALLYYGKNIAPKQYDLLRPLSFGAFGFDHSHDLPTLCRDFGNDFAFQGNLPPETMSLPENEAIAAIESFLTRMKDVPADIRKGWICGLGHGILPTAREDNVRHFIRLLRENF